jgi:hypothetical protein
MSSFLDGFVNYPKLYIHNQINTVCVCLFSFVIIVDRIHRIGQQRACTIHRFIMKGSIEERIVDLQVAKSLQAKGSMQKLKAEEQKKSRLRDLKGLLMIE